MVKIPAWLTDFQICAGEARLKAVLSSVDMLGYQLIAVSQSGDTYTVFFRRSVDG